MKIILDVPLLNQPEGTQHCAVASIRMIMAYNGERFIHEELVKKFPEINKTRVGITPATARFLVQSGYNVFYSMYQEELLDDFIKDKTENNLELFKRKANSLKPESNSKIQWEQIIKFIEAGGRFSTKLQTLEDINSYLEKKIPVRVGIKSSIFYSDPKYKYNHSVVIVGIDNDKYLINDPTPRFKESYWIESDKLLEAWRANGSLFLVATKN
jgi:uncharacterized protein YvpB